MESDTSAASKANKTQTTSQPSKESSEEKFVIQIGPQPPAPEVCSASFDKVKTPCSTTFGNVIYDTEDQLFWLIPDRTSASIKEASYTLEKQLAQGKSAQERLEGLNKTGLLEYFMEPKLDTFLDDAKSKRMRQIEKEQPNIAHRPTLMATRANERTEKRKTNPLLSDADPNRKLTREQVAAEQEELRLAEEEMLALNSLHHEWKKLESEAIKAAKEEGYSYENGNLFSPRAIEARKRVQTYLKAREDLLNDERLKKSGTSEINKFLTEEKKQYEKLIKGSTDGSANYRSYLDWKEKRREKQEEIYTKYVDSIIKVAEFGLAVPEMALTPKEGGTLESGIDQFKSFLDLQSKQLEINKKLTEKYKNWINATGQQAKAPENLVTTERAEWDRLQLEKNKLQLQAENNVNTAQTRRHLLWEPEQFEPKPVDRLVKADFPLRELSMLDQPKKLLSYLSMLNLNNIGSTIKEDWIKLGAKAGSSLKKPPTNSDGKQNSDSALSVFGQWLVQQGSVRIKDQKGAWFDKEGWFDVEKFHAYLQENNLKVALFEDAGNRKEWGDRLRQVIFEDDIRKNLRIFDKSPQAQLVRCLTPQQSTLHKPLKLEGPEFTAAEGFQASAKATFSVDMAKGEVELFKVDLPERSRAPEITFKYLDNSKVEQTVSLGRFSLYIGAKAWGYSGAALMLSSSIQIGWDNSSAGPGLKAVQDAKRAAGGKADMAKTYRGDQQVTGKLSKIAVEDGATAGFNLFAGVQAGILITGALNWAPPSAVSALRKVSTKGLSNESMSQEWYSLARLTAGVSAAAGLGARGEVGISLDAGSLILRIKASIIAGPGVAGEFKFQVGYEAVTELINLFRRELYRNKQNPVIVVEEDARTLMSNLNALALCGFDVGMIYLMGVHTVMSIYEALMRGGKGGSIADTIVNYEDQSELEAWCINAIPAALGPLLMTLISPPRAFSVDVIGKSGDSKEAKRKYDSSQAHLLQQKAVERILGWIVKNAKAQNTVDKAQRQFEEICMCMNSFGVKTVVSGQDYCENRLALDSFMNDAVMRLTDRTADDMRARYKAHVKLLGANSDGYCKRSQYFGRTYVPSGTVTYINPVSKSTL
ncbi:hypothetical protein AB2M95_05270 [Pseudomonas chlororaphis]|uniref:hypothetical protein n=1 Tax=Pseudomonas chlororaphis TaxID=587753 RepID=UPI0034622A6D